MFGGGATQGVRRGDSRDIYAGGYAVGASMAVRTNANAAPRQLIFKARAWIPSRRMWRGRRFHPQVWVA